jgi:hypothetical protein
MATATISQLTAAVAAASGDMLELETAGGASRSITKQAFLGVTLTGTGTLNLGAFTLTVAANSTINGSFVGGMAGGGTLTLPVSASITGGGTLALGGFTLTVGANSAINGSITGGGTVATGGNTLTVSGTATISGSHVGTVNGNISGGGTLATGGFTLTLTSSGTLALGGNTLTVSAASTISGSHVGNVAGNISGNGTIATGGFTLTVSATSTISGSFVGGMTGGGVLTLPVAASITGGGTLALGGFTLTVPATGTAALLGVAQTFTAAQTIQSPAAGTVALTVNADPSSSVNAQVWNRGGTAVATIGALPADRNFTFAAFDNGTGYGPYISIGGNTNASTPSGGWIQLGSIAGTRRLWVDASGNFRVGTSTPSNANDTSGTVVGTQTSQLAEKNILGDGIAPAAALSKLIETPVVEFEYKNGSYNHSRFMGIVADWSPEFAMDEGRVFSPVSAFGYLIQSTKELARRLAAAEAELAQLRGD